LTLVKTNKNLYASMTLTVHDAAQLLNVSEKTVYRWIAERGLPARRVGDQYRLSRAELLDWVTANRAEASIELFTEPEEEAGPLPTLEEALTNGGVVYRVEGSSRDEVLRSAVGASRLPEGVDPEFVYEVLRARERLGSTAVGKGVAMPHPRHPLVLHVTRPSVTLCFLEKPVDYGALDGEPVSALFLILSPTVRGHLNLLGRLALGLRQPGFSRAVREQAARNVILREAARIDALCREPRTSAGRGEPRR
jgi:nitrogen PTS system EIIA component